MPTKKTISKTRQNLDCYSLYYQQKEEYSLTKLNWKDALKINKNQAVYIYSAKVNNGELIKSDFFS